MDGQHDVGRRIRSRCPSAPDSARWIAVSSVISPFAATIHRRSWVTTRDRRPSRWGRIAREHAGADDPVIRPPVGRIVLRDAKNRVERDARNERSAPPMVDQAVLDVDDPILMTWPGDDSSRADRREAVPAPARA